MSEKNQQSKLHKVVKQLMDEQKTKEPTRCPNCGSAKYTHDVLTNVISCQICKFTYVPNEETLQDAKTRWNNHKIEIMKQSKARLDLFIIGSFIGCSPFFWFISFGELPVGTGIQIIRLIWFFILLISTILSIRKMMDKQKASFDLITGITLGMWFTTTVFVIIFMWISSMSFGFPLPASCCSAEQIERLNITVTP